MQYFIAAAAIIAVADSLRYLRPARRTK